MAARLQKVVKLGLSILGPGRFRPGPPRFNLKHPSRMAGVFSFVATQLYFYASYAVKTFYSVCTRA